MKSIRFFFTFLAAACFSGAIAQGPNPSNADKAIRTKMGHLRGLSDADRAPATHDLALQIRQLPSGADKVSLATGLANLSTEGDFGHKTLQEVATTLADALREAPMPATKQGPNFAYAELAQLAIYEKVKVSLHDPEYETALRDAVSTEKARAGADFTLTDLDGHPWTLSALKGKVVLVNFWATWCPPCRKEMPDMGTLYNRFKYQGFVILAISNEEIKTVKPFISQHNVPYTILLDPGNKVGSLYNIQGIPNSFVYDRDGKLVATAIDMRTEGQLLAMLAKAGLK